MPTRTTFSLRDHRVLRTFSVLKKHCRGPPQAVACGCQAGRKSRRHEQCVSQSGGPINKLRYTSQSLCSFASLGVLVCVFALKLAYLIADASRPRTLGVAYSVAPGVTGQRFATHIWLRPHGRALLSKWYLALRPWTKCITTSARGGCRPGEPVKQIRAGCGYGNQVWDGDSKKFPNDPVKDEDRQQWRPRHGQGVGGDSQKVRSDL